MARQRTPNLYGLLVLLTTICAMCVGLTCRCNTPECLGQIHDEDISESSSYGECHADEKLGFCIRRINIKLTNQGGRVRVVRKRQQYRCENSSINDHHLHEFRVRIPLQLTNSLIIEYRCRNGDHCASSLLFDHEQCGGEVIEEEDEHHSEEGMAPESIQNDADHDDNDHGREIPHSIDNDETYILPRISPPERNLSTTICACLRTFYEEDNPSKSSGEYKEKRQVNLLQEEKRNECRWTNYLHRPYQTCRSFTDVLLQQSSSSNPPRSSLSQAGLRAHLVCRDGSDREDAPRCTNKAGNLNSNLDDSWEHFAANRRTSSNGKSNAKKDNRSVQMRCEWRCRYRHNCNNHNEFNNVYCSALEELRRTAVLSVGTHKETRFSFRAAPFGTRLENGRGGSRRNGQIGCVGGSASGLCLFGCVQFSALSVLILVMWDLVHT